MTTVVRAVLLAAAGYAVLVAVVGLFQRRLLYFPPRGYPVNPGDLRIPFEEAVIASGDGTRLTGWWIGSVRTPVVLYFHGNATNLSGLVELAAGFRAAGFSFAAVDYRGYGASEGRPDEQGIYLDAMAAWEWVLGRGAEPGKVIVWGQSLGSGPASWLASRVACGALVLEGAFPSVHAMARLHYPLILLPEFAVLDRYPVVRHVAGARCPVVVIHGELDSISPVSFGRKVFEAAPESRRKIVIVPGEGHNSITPSLPEVGEALRELGRSVSAR